MCFTVYTMKRVVNHVFIQLHILYVFVGLSHISWCACLNPHHLLLVGSLILHISVLQSFSGSHFVDPVEYMYSIYEQVWAHFYLISSFFTFMNGEALTFPLMVFGGPYWNFKVVVLTYFLLVYFICGIDHVFTYTYKKLTYFLFWNNETWKQKDYRTDSKGHSTL